MLKDESTRESKVNIPRTSRYHTPNTSKTKAPPAGHVSPKELTPQTPIRNSIRRTNKPQSKNTARFGPPTPLKEGKVKEPRQTMGANRQRNPLTMTPDLEHANTTNKEAMPKADKAGVKVGAGEEEVEEGEATGEEMTTTAMEATEMT